MDQDEVLRLLQITGISELFKDEDFSRSWDIKDSEISPEELTDDIDPDLKEKNQLINEYKRKAKNTLEEVI
jgi:hypothetical protein